LKGNKMTKLIRAEWERLEDFAPQARSQMITCAKMLDGLSTVCENITKDMLFDISCIAAAMTDNFHAPKGSIGEHIAGIRGVSTMDLEKVRQTHSNIENAILILQTLQSTMEDTEELCKGCLDNVKI
jgi:hypothetical protein